MIGTPAPVHFGGMTVRGQARRSFLNLIFQNRAITKKVFYWDTAFEIRMFTLYILPGSAEDVRSSAVATFAC
jgi:hypothetical protein